MSGTQTGTRSTVVGVFRDRSQAEQAISELKRAGFRDDQIGFVAKDDRTTSTPHASEGVDHSAGAATGAVTGGVLGALAGAAAALLLPGIGPIVAGGILASALGGAAIGAAAGGLIGALTGLGVPEEEARYYDEEFRAGRFVVTVKADGNYQQAYDILHRFGAYDYSSRQAMASTAATGATTAATMQREGEVRVPEVEERLEVEKRPVQAGEVRIHKEVEEKQVSVPVELTREEVHVEKRDVERPLDAGEEAFQEGTIRVPVRAEEAVAHKEAVVTGEVVVNKTRETETQEVSDTVRRTEVHVDKDRMGDTVAPAGQQTVTTSGSWETYKPHYRSMWQSRYGSSGRWEEFEPAYRFGWEMRHNSRFSGRRFEEVETDLQKDWIQRYPSSPWDKFRAHVREAWADVKSAV